MTKPLTVFAETADALATRDREATANARLEVAVKNAVDLIRTGCTERARQLLERESAGADRILGRRSDDPATTTPQDTVGAATASGYLRPRSTRRHLVTALTEETCHG